MNQIKTPNSSSLDNLWKILLSGSIIIYGLMVANNILIPLVTSLFIALLLTPMVSWMERKGINTIVAIVSTLIIVSLVAGGAVYYISIQAKNLILDLPDLTSRFNLFLNDLEKDLVELYGFSAKDQLELVKQNSDKILSSGSVFFSEAISATSNLLTFFTLIPIYLFFFLLYRKNFKHFLRMLEQRNANANYMTIAVEVKQMTNSYLSGLLIVISIIAVLNTTGLLLLGIKYAIFMGVVSAILTIIPYIGVFIGAGLPIIVALITKDSLFYPLGVAVLYGLVQFIEGNFITPNVIGSKVDVNPLAAIIALIIGAQIWGIVGMILAIPLCGILKIVFNQYEATKPYAVLLQSSSNDVSDNRSLKRRRLKIKKILQQRRKK